MTEHYWQRYKEQISKEFMNNPDNKFWQNVKKDLARNEKPKHHLELYSMCKSQNPYIKQVKNSPNITTQTVAELICRDKACELQYCLSLMKVATQNRRRIIDLKGCKEQQNVMWNCIRQEETRVNKRQQQLKNLVFGLKETQEEKPVVIQQQKKLVVEEEPMKYI